MLTIVGDVHGNYHPYIDLVKDTEASIQLGDMGFVYNGLAKLDPGKHKFFGGNHDNYGLYYKSPHALGDFGVEELGGVTFFYVRGAFSIDKKYRSAGISWWPEEELTREEFEKARKLYVEVKPDIMITHESPRQVSELIGNPGVLREFGFDPDRFTTNTSEGLQDLFDLYHPKEWYFGHFHKSWTRKVNGTIFHCLNELETVTIS